MAETQEKQPVMVQMYDKSIVKEYIKIFKGFIFRTEEVVNRETIESDLILTIETIRQPTKILLNGKEII